MNISEPSDENYLKWLKQETRLAFFLNTGRKLQATPTKDNPYFKLLERDMIDELDLKGNAERQPPKVGTLIKLFCTKAIDFTPTTLIIFEDYVFSVKKKFKLLDRRINNAIVFDNTLLGVILISPIFLEAFNDEREIEHSDFYLGRLSNDSQWYGVIRHWDIERKDQYEVIDHCSKCFTWDSKITALINGTSGCGKSTFLRRIALELADSMIFRVLWITDLEVFCDKTFEYIANNNDRFLVIFDDWTLIESDESLITKFLSKARNCENMRFMIGDCKKSRPRPYEKYLLTDKKFELRPFENTSIIDAIKGINKKLKNVNNDIFTENQLSSTPLFILVFIISREIVGSEQSPTLIDAVSRFRNIIYEDFAQINTTYPGLGKALYFWAKVTEEYQIKIIWQFFLALADYYNGNSEVSRRVKAFDTRDPICSILAHYFSIDSLAHPEYNNWHFMIGHHQLLTNNGLIHVQTDYNWNDWAKCEFVCIAVFLKKHYIASYLSDLFNLSKSLELNEPSKHYNANLNRVYPPEYSIEYLNKYAHDIYSLAPKLNTEKQFQDLIKDIVLLTIDYSDAFEYCAGIFRYLIENGCNSLSIKGIFFCCIDEDTFDEMSLIYILRI